jgi:hypothetical protein
MLKRIFDFGNKPTDPVEIDARSIKTPIRRNLIGTIKKPDYIFHQLSIADIVFPDTIQVADIGKLLYIELAVKPKGSKNVTRYRQSTITNFRITDNEVQYKLFFDPTQIQDYTDFSANKQTIRFSLESKVKSTDSVRKVQSYELELEFIKAHSVPKLRLFIKPDFNSFEYKRDEKLLLGHIEVVSEAACSYAEPLDSCKLFAKMPGGFGEVLFLTDDLASITESNPTMGGAGLLEQNDNMESDLYKERLPEGAVLLENLLPNNKVKVPIYINLDSYGNPNEPTSERIIAYAEYKKGDTPYDETVEKSIHLLPDTTTTQLMKRVIWGKQQRKMEHENMLDLAHHVQWQPEGKGKHTCFTLKIGNSAQNNEGSVHVRNLNFNFKLAANSSSTIVKTESKSMPLENIQAPTSINLNDIIEVEVTQNGIKVPNWENAHAFPNGPNSYLEIKARIQHKNIANIPNLIASINSRIQFEYAVNSNDNQVPGAWTNFKTKLDFNLEKNPGKFWLGLDFGTSASVAAFDDGEHLRHPDTISNILLNLQKPLEALITSLNGNAAEYTAGQVEEFGSKFLSSTAMLDADKKLEPSTYLEALLKLSPTENRKNAYYKFIIPYLKSLIGTQHLPNFDGNFSNFNYRDSSGKQLNFKTHPIPTVDVLAMAYYSLLIDFADKTAKIKSKRDKLNKLVITVPNSFTPKHLQTLRNVLDNPANKLSHFRKDYTTFLSESDAVAIHYDTLWRHYNNERTNKTDFKNGKEYVLIYDMGAGTLDITYLAITKNNGETQKIEVLGRLGKSTAGNYMDYVIASIIYNKYAEDFAEEGINPDFSREAEGDNEFPRQLKSLIQKKIKPFLGEDFGILDLEAEIQETGGNSLINPFREKNITADDIINSSLYKAAIKENTEEVFNNFFDLYRSSADGSKIYGKGNFPLDTIVLSGRSSQLAGLKSKVLSELQQWSGNSQLYAPPALKGDVLKSAVVQGAMQFALLYRNQEKSPVKIKNRNIQAKYGLYYIDGSGQAQFKELLNPMTRPLNTNPVIQYSLSIYTYDTDKYDAEKSNDNKPNTVDVSRTSKAWFVQSFAKDTAGDLNKNKWEYITKIVSFDPDAVGGDMKNLKVGIQVDSNNEMTFHYGDGSIDEQEPLRIDLESSASFRRSMWPYLKESNPTS